MITRSEEETITKGGHVRNTCGGWREASGRTGGGAAEGGTWLPWTWVRAPGKTSTSEVTSKVMLVVKVLSVLPPCPPD